MRQPKKHPLLTYDGELAEPIKFKLPLEPRAIRIARLAIELALFLAWLVLGVLIFQLFWGISLLIGIPIYLVSVAIVVRLGRNLAVFCDAWGNTADADGETVNVIYSEALRSLVNLLLIIPLLPLPIVRWLMGDNQYSDLSHGGHRRPGKREVSTGDQIKNEGGKDKR